MSERIQRNFMVIGYFFVIAIWLPKLKYTEIRQIVMKSFGIVEPLGRTVIPTYGTVIVT